MKNNTLALKCSVYECCMPAETYFACGIVKGKAKTASISNESRLFKVSAKGDVAVPLCHHHITVISRFIDKISK